MLNFFRSLYHRYLSAPDSIVLAMFICTTALIFWLFAKMLAPVFASIVIAYLLDGFVIKLERWNWPHALAVITVYSAFITFILFVLLGPIPLLWQQLTNLCLELPHRFTQLQVLFNQLVALHPEYFSVTKLQAIVANMRGDFAKLGQFIFSASLASIPSVLEVVIYLILVPILVYFFLMDKQKILNALRHYLPRHNAPLRKIRADLKLQVGNYVRGKVWEIIINWVVCYAVFWSLGFRYAVLMSALVGISVIIPYIGAFVVTLPITILALLQWGFTPHTTYFLLAYGIILLLDANILVPILFSNAVALHPVAIIIAILVFGGMFGFWGIFFAIPLASLTKAILQAWPVAKD
jgi:putative permease